MAYEPNDSRPFNKVDPAERDHNSIVLERVQELSWALLDEQITDDEMRLLDNLLLSDDEARRTYVGCVQLHTILVGHFRNASVPTGTRTGKSLVLGFLNDTAPSVGLPATPSENVKS